MFSKGRADARPFGLGGAVTRVLWAVFVGYCALLASAWLLSPATSWLRCLAYVAAGVVAGVLNRRGRLSSGSGGWRDVVRLGVASLLVGVVPEALSSWALQRVSSSLLPVVMAFVPVVVVLVAANVERSEGAESRAMLVPALVGLAGILLLIPVEFPGSRAGQLGWFVLLGSAVLVAGTGVWIHGLLRQIGVMKGITIFCLANGVAWGVRAMLDGGTVGGGWMGVMSAVVEAVLVVVLLRGMEPVRFAGRFLVIPLVTILEGFVLLRPGFTWRMGAGLVLLAGGAVWLLVGRGEDRSVSLL